MYYKITILLCCILFSSCNDNKIVHDGNKVILNYKIYNSKHIRLDESDLYHDVNCMDKAHIFSFIVGRNEVIKGWDSLIIGCKKNKIYTFSIPTENCYGNEKIYHDIPANSDLILTFKIIDIE